MFEQHRLVSKCDVLCLTDTQTYSMEGFMWFIGISHCPMTVHEDGGVMLFAGRDNEGKDLGMTINDRLGEGEHCRGLIEKNIDVGVIFVLEGITNQEIKDYIKGDMVEYASYRPTMLIGCFQVVILKDD
ncbi:hypothetical protein MTO96_029182 [Rhipicephalus appendiculatus]